MDATLGKPRVAPLLLSFNNNIKRVDIKCKPLLVLLAISHRGTLVYYCDFRLSEIVIGHDTQVCGLVFHLEISTFHLEYTTLVRGLSCKPNIYVS